jgi:thioredoxin 1
MVTIINSSNEFHELVSNNDKVLVDFYADWCGPCKMMGPIVEEIASEINTEDSKNKIKICKVNVDQNSDLAAEFSVQSIPTLIYFKNGEFNNKIIGLRPKEDILKIII